MPLMLRYHDLGQRHAAEKLQGCEDSALRYKIRSRLRT